MEISLGVVGHWSLFACRRNNRDWQTNHTYGRQRQPLLYSREVVKRPVKKVLKKEKREKRGERCDHEDDEDREKSSEKVKIQKENACGVVTSRDTHVSTQALRKTMVL